MFVKIIGPLVKTIYLFQISVRELHKDIILSIHEEGFFGAITVNGKVSIIDILLRKYTPKYIKPMSNRNKITCGCKTCISTMLLQ